LWFDAKPSRLATAATSIPRALLIAYSVDESARREAIGLDIGEIQTEAGSCCWGRCASVV